MLSPDPLYDLLRAGRDGTTVAVGITYRTVRSVCAGPGCEVMIEQPDRPGRKRLYHNAACRQAAFRARKREADAKTAAWLRALNQL